MKPTVLVRATEYSNLIPMAPAQGNHLKVAYSPRALRSRCCQIACPRLRAAWTSAKAEAAGEGDALGTLGKDSPTVVGMLLVGETGRYGSFGGVKCTSGDHATDGELQRSGDHSGDGDPFRSLRERVTDMVATRVCSCLAISSARASLARLTCSSARARTTSRGTSELLRSCEPGDVAGPAVDMVTLVTLVADMAAELSSRHDSTASRWDSSSVSSSITIRASFDEATISRHAMKTFAWIAERSRIFSVRDAVWAIHQRVKCRRSSSSRSA